MTILSDHQKAIAMLDDCADVKVLRRFRPRHAYGIVEDPKIGLFVDVETTGLNTELDEIIQFAGARFEFDADGNVGHVGPTYSALQDPGAPLTPEIVEITGLTDERLKGQKIDDAKVAEILTDVVLVIAHNAYFDRRMVENRFKGFDKIGWGCSQRDVKWEKFGCRGMKLDYIMMLLCSEFFDAHDALNDCLAGVHVLATPRVGGVSPFQVLLETARQPTHRLIAHKTAFQTKDKLSQRGYRWQPDPVRAWAKDLRPDEVEAERAWLRQEIYGPAGDSSKVKRISALDRYSVRA